MSWQWDLAEFLGTPQSLEYLLIVKLLLVCLSMISVLVVEVHLISFVNLFSFVCNVFKVTSNLMTSYIRGIFESFHFHSFFQCVKFYFFLYYKSADKDPVITIEMAMDWNIRLSLFLLLFYLCFSLIFSFSLSLFSHSSYAFRILR